MNYTVQQPKRAMDEDSQGMNKSDSRAHPRASRPIIQPMARR